MTIETSTDKTIFERRESQVRSYCRAFDTVFTRASGSTLHDADGNSYTDFLAGCSSLNYGHNDPDMKAALIEHIAQDGIAHALDMYTGPKAEFLSTMERLILAPRGMDHKVMMTGPTGTNAVEAAIKLARKVTGRSNVIAFTNGFHGMTLGALSLTGNAGKRHGAGVPLSGTTHLPYEGALGEDVDTLEMIETMLDNGSSGIDAPAAFVLELVRRYPGRNRPLRRFLQLRRHGRGARHDHAGQVAVGLRAALRADAGEARARHLETGRAQRHLPGQHPRLRHRARGAREILGR